MRVFVCVCGGGGGGVSLILILFYYRFCLFWGEASSCFVSPSSLDGQKNHSRLLPPVRNTITLKPAPFWLFG